MVKWVEKGSAGDDGVGFDLDEHLGGDEPRDLDAGGGGVDAGEGFAVGAGEVSPIDFTAMPDRKNRDQSPSIVDPVKDPIIADA